MQLHEMALYAWYSGGHIAVGVVSPFEGGERAKKLVKYKRALIGEQESKHLEVIHMELEPCPLGVCLSLKPKFQT